MNSKDLLLSSIVFCLSACNSKKIDFDASGTFNATEVIVSAEAVGEIIELNIKEGDALTEGEIVGKIDSKNLQLQKEQVQATMHALGEKKMNGVPKVKLLKNKLEVQHARLNHLLHEKKRFENLLIQDAATEKQVDGIKAKIDVAKKQIGVTEQEINVHRNQVSTKNRSVMSATAPLEKEVALINNQIKNATIVNPISGIVLTKYAEENELATIGKPLYKIANLSKMTLRVYITGRQFSQVKLNQKVKILVEDSQGTYKGIPGQITWISDKAEFTPKTIQTKDERANLVYAIKIKVNNNGYLKIGMYGDVIFNPKQEELNGEL